MSEKRVFIGSLPYIKCPCCEAYTQIYDYYDTESGDTFICRVCNGTIYVHSADRIIEVVISNEPEQNPLADHPSNPRRRTESND